MPRQAKMMDVPSACGGVKWRALQWRRETHVLGFNRHVGVQLLRVVGGCLTCCTLRELAHSSREEWI